MKLQYIIIYLAILNVVCCYPSSGENESQIEQSFRSSESGSISVNMPLSYLDETQIAKDNYFPEVEYPTKSLDTIEPFYLRAADHVDSLTPFTSDVKDSFRSLQAEQKVKEHSARQDSIPPRDINIQQTVENSDDLLVNNSSFFNVANTSEVSVSEGYLQVASEEDVEISDDTNSQLNLDNENIEPTSEEVEICNSTNSQFNVDTDTSVATLDDSSENSDETVSLDDENE